MQRDLVFISLEDWDQVWRRNQFVCAELSRRFPERKILFVGLPRNFSHAARTGGLMNLPREAATSRLPEFPNITVTRPTKLLPESLRWGRWLNDRLFRGHLKKAARSAGIDPGFVLWLNSHSAVHLVGRLGESGVVYDITDDWTSFDQPPNLRLRTIRQDAALCAGRCGDRLLTTIVGT